MKLVNISNINIIVYFNIAKVDYNYKKLFITNVIHSIQAFDNLPLY